MTGRASLPADERGMILIIALPMTALLVGALFYVVSVGDAVLHRERLQDAADATAFESAVLHARAMNAEVALNLLSTSLSSLSGAVGAVDALARLAQGGFEPARVAQRELPARVGTCVQAIRDAQLALRTIAPRLATAEATRKNTAVYAALDAADGSIALSYAALGVSDQASLGADNARPWLLTPRSAASEAAHAASARLPLELAAPGDADAPLLISRDAQNGNAVLQTWSVARRERFAAQASDERAMSLASPARPVQISAKNAAFAQAEYYFDCADSWQRCAPDAAYMPRWTARLRRFERPDGSLDAARTQRIARAFMRASDALEPALQAAGQRSRRARDYVHALFDAPACGGATCLH